MRKTTAEKVAQAHAIADRRRKVATLMVARIEQQEMARQLGVSDSTISNDVAAIYVVWQADQTAQAGVRSVQDLAAWESDERMWRTRLAGEATLKGRLEIYDRILKIQQARAKRLGLDAPTKIAPTDPTGTQPYGTWVDAVRAANHPLLTEGPPDAP